MNRKRLTVSLAAVATIGALALAPTAHASQGPWSSGVKSCGSKYVGGKTTGYSNIWVNAAGDYSSGTYNYPGGTVVGVGDHTGTVSSYASTQITSWGFTGCTLK